MIKGSLWNPELERLYRMHFGREIYTCNVLSSHGSDRIILRLRPEGERKISAGASGSAGLPRSKEKLSEASPLPEVQPTKGERPGESAIGIINKDVRENTAFIEFSRHFRKFKLRVPEIYGVSDDMSCYITEDLGDVTLFSMIDRNGFGNRMLSLYKKILRELMKFQAEAGPTIDYTLCYQFNEFGEENIDYDLKYFKGMFLDNYHGKYDNSKLMRDFSCLKEKLLECGRDYFLYRDFQSRNIMIKDAEPYFIDYQSGRRGAPPYDLASLLYDAKADLPQEIRESLIDYYVSKLSKLVKVEPDEFKNYFWYFAIIRILQALGAYGYLGLSRGKKRFLESIPYAVKNISFILNNRIENGNLKYLRNIFEKLDERKENQRA